MRLWLRFVMIAAVTITGAGECLSGDTFVYCSLPGEKRIAVFRQEAATGGLKTAASLATDGEPAALVVAPNRRFLFASYRPEGKLAAFRRDPTTGQLTLVNVVDAGLDPAHLSFDATGRWLFSAYYVAAKAAVHRIGDDGALVAPAQQEVPTIEKAHAAALDRSQRFLFVPHTGPNRIYQFRWDLAKGRLMANDPPYVQTPPGSGPRHVVFHPKLPFAYVNNEQGGSVTRYEIQADRGTLTPLETVSTLPIAFAGANATAELRMHPSGRFLFCANRGHDSVARFGLDDQGRLTAMGQTGCVPTPRSFDIDPAGRFLYVGGELSGKLGCYRIAPDSGDLTLFETIPVGARLWWVLAVSE